MPHLPHNSVHDWLLILIFTTTVTKMCANWTTVTTAPTDCWLFGIVLNQ